MRLRGMIPIPSKIAFMIRHIRDYPFGNVPHPDDIIEHDQDTQMKIPESELDIQSPRGEAKLTSMPKRNRGSGTNAQRKMRRYKPVVPGKCKSGYFYDSKSRMCVLKSRR